eukprot:TRINITY_DN278_c0_g1_i6.p1 TRINITY_DN278_c0_g1~~TRINITY_DN278_c0_g1_i6.p1  ORF type:complete len:848 (+),score=153.93 TRINITY_DN278_c0_g1_i6:170-2713(+)
MTTNSNVVLSLLIFAGCALLVTESVPLEQRLAQDLESLERDIRDLNSPSADADADVALATENTKGGKKKGAKSKKAVVKSKKAAVASKKKGKLFTAKPTAKADPALSTAEQAFEDVVAPENPKEEMERADPKEGPKLLKAAGLDKLKTDAKDKRFDIIGYTPSSSKQSKGKSGKSALLATASELAEDEGADADIDAEADASRERQFRSWLNHATGSDQLIAEAEDDHYHHIYHLEDGSGEWKTARPEDVLLSTLDKDARVSQHYPSSDWIFNSIWHTRNHWVSVADYVAFFSTLTAAELVQIRNAGAGGVCNGLRGVHNAGRFTTFCRAVKETYEKWEALRDDKCRDVRAVVAGGGPMGLMQAFYIWKCRAASVNVTEMRGPLPRPNNSMRMQQPVFRTNIQNLLTSFGVPYAETGAMVMYDFELILSKYLDVFGISVTWNRKVRAICYDSGSSEFKVYVDVRGNRPYPDVDADSTTYCVNQPPAGAEGVIADVVFGAEGTNSRVREIGDNANTADNNKVGYVNGLMGFEGAIHSNGDLDNARRTTFANAPVNSHGAPFGHDVSQDENLLPLKPQATAAQEIHALNVFISLQNQMTHQNGAATSQCHAVYGGNRPRLHDLWIDPATLRGRLAANGLNDAQDQATFDLLEQGVWLNPKLYKTATGVQVCWIELILRHNFGTEFTTTHAAHLTAMNGGTAWNGGVGGAAFVTAIHNLVSTIINGKVLRNLQPSAGTTWWNDYLGSNVNDAQFAANIQWVRVFQQRFRFVRKPVVQLSPRHLPSGGNNRVSKFVTLALLGDATRDSYYPFGYGLNSAELELWENVRDPIHRINDQAANIKTQIINAGWSL